jgi:hypothetical protein
MWRRQAGVARAILPWRLCESVCDHGQSCVNCPECGDEKFKVELHAVHVWCDKSQGLSPLDRPCVEEIFGPVVTVHPFDTEVAIVALVV